MKLVKGEFSTNSKDFIATMEHKHEIDPEGLPTVRIDSENLTLQESASAFLAVVKAMADIRTARLGATLSTRLLRAISRFDATSFWVGWVVSALFVVVVSAAVTAASSAGLWWVGG